MVHSHITLFGKIPIVESPDEQQGSLRHYDISIGSSVETCSKYRFTLSNNFSDTVGLLELKDLMRIQESKEQKRTANRLERRDMNPQMWLIAQEQAEAEMKNTLNNNIMRQKKFYKRANNILEAMTTSLENTGGTYTF